MKFVLGLLLFGAGLNSAWPGTPGSRGPHDYPDSLRSLPPRMRGFGDKYYFETFVKPQTQESLNVKCVGRWPWGPSYEVTAQGDTLYLASGSGVRIVDITTPTNPRHIGQICARGLVNQVVIRDSLLYVASNGLEIFNVSNPVSPTKRSWLNIPVSDFGLKDSFAVCIGDSLRIIKIKDPGNPIRVGASADSGYSIFVKDNYAYSGSRWELAIINISNPQNPRRAGSRGAYVHALWVQGNHCYTTTGDQGFTIYNIRDTLNIWEEGRIGTLWSYDVYVIGMFAYTPNFAVIDISDSSNPAIVGSVNMPCGPDGVWVKSPFTYGFVADWYEGLQVVNINDPTTPRIDTAAFKADAARDIFVQNNRAYIADDRCGMKVLDISNIQQPFEIGSYDTLGQEPLLSSIWVVDTIGYLGDDITPFPSRFAVTNVKDPSNIQRLGSCGIPNNNESEDMYLKNSDSIIYSANQSYFFGFKIKNPNLPSLACSLRLGMDEAHGLFVKDTFAYVEGWHGLKIISISTPANPVLVGQCSTHGGVAIYVKDSIAYVAGGSLGLVIVNVANPSSPYEITRFPTRYSLWDVWVKDTLAYLCSGGYLQVVNVKDPRTPYEVGYYSVAYYARRIFHDGGYVYTANSEAGLMIFEYFNTGIEESSARFSLSLNKQCFPIPTRSKIYFSAGLIDEIKQFQLFDIMGRTVMTRRNQHARDGLMEVDISVLKPGIYFLILEKKTSRVVFKIVKI